MNPKLTVLKFGGTSVASVEAILHAACAIEEIRASGVSVVVVVSAMAGTTDQLVAWVRELSPLKDDCDTDAVMASGEQVSAGLLSLALKAKGIPARSWLAWQIPLYAEGPHGSAELKVQPVPELNQSLARGEVAVVAGFQGITPRGNLVTLGRGSSDTTAVIVAACLEASKCIIYTDVDGVYTADPRVLPESRKLSSVSYPKMWRFAYAGAKVLHPEAVRRAAILGVPLEVRSSFSPSQAGTDVIENSQDAPGFIGITCVKNMVQCFSLFPDDAMVGCAWGRMGLAWGQASFMQRYRRGWSWVMREDDFQNWWRGSSEEATVGHCLQKAMACATLVADIPMEAFRAWWIHHKSSLCVPLQGLELAEGRLSLLVSQDHLADLVGYLHKCSGLSVS